MPDSLSAAAARRIALGAQGFARPRAASPTRRQLAKTIRDLGVLQIDSVNVFERSHYLPVLARAGAYSRADLDALTHRRDSDFIEYWGHEATFMPRDAWPLFHWRMDEARAKDMAREDSWAHTHSAVLTRVADQLADHGTATARQLGDDADRGKGSWWGWSDSKRALETLFRWGDVVSAGRRGFERVYAPAVTDVPAEFRTRTLSRDDAITELVARAADRLGIGTTADIADYFRLPTADTRRALRDLADAGHVREVSVPEWTTATGRSAPTWLAASARTPRRITRDELLSPFDPVVWARPRAERMFNFHYRIEIYTPAHKRVHGYYVLPVLLGDQVAARLDLKHDRPTSRILVQSAWVEPGAPADTAERVAELLRRTALWQGSDSIEVAGRGSLAQDLSAALSASTGPSAILG
ncbi:MAG: winged helix-turn-helix domain-containing protein [Mycetocola sp.]